MASSSRSTKLDLVREVEEEVEVAEVTVVDAEEVVMVEEVVDTEEVDMEEGVMEVTVEVADRTEVCN